MLIPNFSVLQAIHAIKLRRRSNLLFLRSSIDWPRLRESKQTVDALIEVGIRSKRSAAVIGRQFDSVYCPTPWSVGSGATGVNAGAGNLGRSGESFSYDCALLIKGPQRQLVGHHRYNRTFCAFLRLFRIGVIPQDSQPPVPFCRAFNLP